MVPGYGSSRKGMLVLFGVAVWHCVAFAVASDVVFYRVTGHKASGGLVPLT